MLSLLLVNDVSISMLLFTYPQFIKPHRCRELDSGKVRNDKCPFSTTWYTGSTQLFSLYFSGFCYPVQIVPPHGVALPVACRSVDSFLLLSLPAPHTSVLLKKKINKTNFHWWKRLIINYDTSFMCLALVLPGCRQSCSVSHWPISGLQWFHFTF